MPPARPAESAEREGGHEPEAHRHHGDHVVVRGEVARDAVLQREDERGQDHQRDPERGVVAAGRRADGAAGRGAQLRPSAAKSARRSASGRAPMWLITSPAATQPMRAQVSQSRPGGQPVQEAGGEEVAGAGHVDHPDGGRRRVHPRAVREHVRAAGADGADGDRHVRLGARHRGLEVVGQVERHQLVLVRHHQVHVGADQRQERLAVAFDAERVGKGDRGPAAGGLGGARGPGEGGLALGAVEEVALEQQPLGGAPSGRGSMSAGPSVSATPR